MRFHFGAIPISSDITPDASWKPLRQPSPWMALFAAIPIGIVSAVAVAGLWLAMTPLHLHDMTALSLRGMLLSFAGMVVVHELIHVLVHPMSGRSPQSIVGAGGPTTGIYAHYAGEMTRNRLVAIYFTPLVVISFVPLLVAAVAQVASGWVAFISVVNAFGACLDILDAGLILLQVPAAARVRFRSLKIYWREHETPTA
ncbi:MAG: DUF3267 domain-containing protein [Phycisphaerae bacterium]|nr:DUF3267 domain-containing protein [Phycisphaerae bacterium]